MVAVVGITLGGDSRGAVGMSNSGNQSPLDPLDSSLETVPESQVCRDKMLGSEGEPVWPPLLLLALTSPFLFHESGEEQLI